MTRSILLIGPTPITEYSAAYPRLRSFEEALTAAGWTVMRSYRLVESPDMTKPQRRRTGIPASVIRFLTGIGIADEVQVRALLQVRQFLRKAPHDAVMVTVPPFSLVACSLFTRAPTVLDYRDIFGAAARPHLVARCLTPLEARLAQRFSAITYAGGARLGEHLASRLHVNQSVIHRITNGVFCADVGELPIFSAETGPRPLDIVWVGHLYGFANLSPILRALEHVGPDVARLHIIGPTTVHTRERYARGDMANVSFEPALRRKELYHRLAQADFGLIVLNDGYPYEVSVPAKYYDYVAAGLSILYLGPSGAAFQDEPGNSLVHHLMPEDHEEICEFLRSATSSRLPKQKHNYIAQVDRAIGATYLVKVLETL